MAKIKVQPLPNAFIPGIPAIVHEFDSQAEAEKWLKGEEGGYARASAFSLESPKQPDKESSGSA